MSRGRAGGAAGARIEALAVTRVYGAGTAREVWALDAVSLTVEPGAFVALSGPSGCGKTTLLRLLGALDRPSSGEVRHDGRSLSTLSESELTLLRRRVGLVFQEGALLPRLPAWENVAYPLVPWGVPRRERRERALAELDRVRVAHLAHKPPEELSGGERQRVGIARALVVAPTALLADEPTAHLDADSAQGVVDVLRDLRGGGVTLLVATHSGDLLGVADQVFALRPAPAARSSRGVSRP